ncbi:hypothetical protein G6F63_015564 [Rhizopus arrhizus]|nr:hypothetical protein G6F63_015564 [Rhizopus arrhizus]
MIGRRQRRIGAEPLRHQRRLGAVVGLAQDVDGRGFQPARAIRVLGGGGRLHRALEVAPQAAFLVFDRYGDVHAEAHHRAAAACRHHAAVRRERTIEALAPHRRNRLYGAGTAVIGIQRDALVVAGIGRPR